MLDTSPFHVGLSEKQRATLDHFLGLSDESFQFLQPLLMENAAAKGKTINPVHLRLAQLRPVAMSYVNPRFFIGDKPGLGKTVMSAGCVALYQSQQRKKGLPVKKVLVVTDTSHVKGFAKEWASFGIPLMQLAGGKIGIDRTLKTHKLDDFEGIIINWDTLKTNRFIQFYAEHFDEFEIAVFDETSRLLNPKNTLYKVTNMIVNTYQGGIPRVIFLNGSSFEKNIYDFYYQFNILQPTLIATKTYLEENYVIREGRKAIQSDYVVQGGHMYVQHVLSHTGAIVEYKNQSVLRQKLQYYFLARSKKDYSKDIPTHSYILHLIEMTPAQKKLMQQSKVISKINSPATSNPKADMTRKTMPKLDFLLNHAVKVAEDRPLIYAYNIEAQHLIARELTDLGYRVAIINGEQSTILRDELITQFNNYELDMLVFNIRKAVNIPTSDRIILYDIPTMPQQTIQLAGRIDRDNYDKGKFYDFLCYLNSPEMENIVRLAYFRETQSSAFTGQQEDVYKTLQTQLQHVINADNLIKAHEILLQLEEGIISYSEIQQELDQLISCSLT